MIDQVFHASANTFSPSAIADITESITAVKRAIKNLAATTAENSYVIVVDFLQNKPRHFTVRSTVVHRVINKTSKGKSKVAGRSRPHPPGQLNRLHVKERWSERRNGQSVEWKAGKESALKLI